MEPRQETESTLKALSVCNLYYNSIVIVTKLLGCRLESQVARKKSLGNWKEGRADCASDGWRRTRKAETGGRKGFQEAKTKEDGVMFAHFLMFNNSLSLSLFFTSICFHVRQLLLIPQKSSNGTFVDEEGDGDEDAEASGPIFVPQPTDFASPLLQEYVLLSFFLFLLSFAVL
jgi:hypothetical protein